MTTKHATLVFLVKDNSVLLAMKKRGFGEGRFNGIGGKIEPGESVEKAMVRETEEEIGVTPTTYSKVADITFDEFFKDKPALMHIHVFIASAWKGEPVESEEMAPEWFLKNSLPLDTMWPDDPYWLPQVLNGDKIIGHFKLDKQDKIVEYKLTPMSD